MPGQALATQHELFPLNGVAPQHLGDPVARCDDPVEPVHQAGKAPMVGTVYLAPQPDAAPFIKVGDQVRAGQTLLIVEAMKVMNNIAAPRAGRVAAILVIDGMPVEYDQPLLVLE